jgi:hypothetical protein
MYQGANPAWMNPFLQYLLGGGGMGGGTSAGANPFFNLYSPAPPGTSQTTALPTPMAGPGSFAPPIAPPPTSATIVPMPTATGAAPIGQIPPAPAGTVAAGQGSQAVPMPTVAAMAVPPFMATMPSPPTPLAPQALAGSGAGGTAAAPVTWEFQNGRYINVASGQPGQPSQNDLVRMQGGTPMPYSQFQAQYLTLPPAGPFTNQAMSGRTDTGGFSGGGGDRAGGGRF